MSKNNEPQQSSAAVALKYDGERAPTISAVGNHELADEIIRIAREHGVPLYENAELASTLARLSLNDEIPEQLYQLVAEILAFAFHIRGMTPEDAGQ
ncbi:EscU/YscU/HrcU family type III secretion system export apparatus switch protein [Marinobacter sp. M3C]|jgi:flagellar biosynthesis protein|uniref:EscU/YscU/HrcU family type III secretion system export apparatus switch protein n=1 Tax=unclassified Marinobacter TaxID=83889 RepID=UPI00200C378D|nr:MULTISPECIES: EscU/YscU/HrcU family type III secretion system export apparatus switch protein [unclassified Marinobacter]MCL1479173.1 EscU/YscU/HrcU family type III secretion system export apparatus switch protein [Marinobacter sp.]MCL1482814.1 EscU/YscU/HrcU family type III secretion system export apparatus switch protein [Marinobacter sp.]UQG57245.1 EscU/YscU/HrcU family type III secretion system export apparatus switch protein [Marinobacter sp. M4C]UQG61572.1 EscU/YscU/HrcU family type II